MTDEPADSGRDTKGRFSPGNPGGPGGPRRRRAHAFRHAAQDAISEEHIQAMIRKAAALALQGNLTAMRFVFERTAGRVPDEPADPEPVAVTLPELHTAADCNVALERLMAGVCRGTIDREAARLLTDMIHVRVRVIETKELEQRLGLMEKAIEAKQEDA